MPSTVTSILDGLSTSVAVKAPCATATTVNITLSGLQTLDGITVVDGDRVLVKDQSTQSENGIYVASTGSWTRAKDFDGNRDARRGTLVLVANSGINFYYRVTTANPIIIGTSSLVFEAVAGTLTQSSIGAAFYPLTTAESAATLVNADLNRIYPEGQLERYKLTGDGSTDDAAAFANAALVAAQGVQLLGTPGKTYVLSSAITLGSIFSLDLRGATIKPGGNSGRFTSTAATATATTTVSSGASQGSRSIVVASATGLVVGQTVLISATDFPNFWCKITSIASTTIELDRLVPLTYAGTINFASYATLPAEVSIVNGVFDGANVTGSAGNSGQALRLLNFKRITLDKLRVINYAPASGANRPIHIDGCIDVVAEGIRATDNDIGNSDNILFVNGARKALITECIVDGGGFGFNIELSETAMFTDNQLSGRRQYEEEEGVSPVHSVRALKAKSNGYTLVSGNDISDYETAVKIENYHRFVVASNIVRNVGIYGYDGQGAIAATSTALPEEPYGIISDNLIDTVGGNAVMIDTFGASTTDANVIVNSNIIKNCGRHAVYCGQQKITVNGNRIENWNTSDTGTGTTSAAIASIGGGIIATGNSFENSDATDVCFNVGIVAGQVYTFRDNARLSANPYFNGGLLIEQNGGTANIASGATSVVVAHGMLRTPGLGEIDLRISTNPTNDPGFVYPSAIDATNITIACRADPGASTMNVRWEIRPQMPFTA